MVQDKEDTPTSSRNSGKGRVSPRDVQATSSRSSFVVACARTSEQKLDTASLAKGANAKQTQSRSRQLAQARNSRKCQVGAIDRSQVFTEYMLVKLENLGDSLSCCSTSCGAETPRSTST